MAQVVEIPPERCSQCSETALRPGWDECPLPTCRKMGRTYLCANGHVTVATWHQHRVVPSERPRWRCQSEPPPSSSSKNPV
jgi:hypothetical protein